MAIGVDRGRRAPAPTNVDAATEADFLCALRKCVQLLAGLTATGIFLSMPAEPEKHGMGVLLGIDGTARSILSVYFSTTTLGVSLGILALLQSKKVGTHGIKYSRLQVFITLDVLGLIGSYSAASVKTSILAVAMVAAVLLYIAIQVLLFLSKPVGRLFSHVQETPPQKCLKSEKRVSLQQTIVSMSSRQSKLGDAYIVATKSVKYVFLVGILSTSTMYEVRLGPMSSASGNSDTHITHPRTRELVHFRWNDTSSVASLVFILILVLSWVFSKQRAMCRALQVAMTLDLFALVVAYASRSCPQLPKFWHMSVLAPVSIYAGIHVMASVSEMFLTCATWRRVLREKMDQRVPNWFNELVLYEMSMNEHTEEGALERNLEDMRQLVLLFAIAVASIIKNLASMSLSPSLLLESRSGHVVDNRTCHSNKFYVGNLTDQAGMGSLSSLWQENTPGHVRGKLNQLAFYCYAAGFTGNLAIIVLLTNRKLSSRGIYWYALSLCIILGPIGLVGAVAFGDLPTVDVFAGVFAALVSMAYYIILSRGPRQRAQSILGWLQQTIRGEPSDSESEEEGSEDELELGLAGGGTNGEPVAVEISSPIPGGAVTLVLAIPVMGMLGNPLQMLVAFAIASTGAFLWRRLFARLLQALARALQRRCLPNQASMPTGCGTTSLACRGWHVVSAMCHLICKMIHELRSGAWVWMLLFIISVPSLSNIKLKLKISRISALVGVLIALATASATATTTTMDSPTTTTAATGTTTSAKTTTTSGTTSRRRKHQPPVELRPRRNCRPNTRLISDEWVNY